MDTIEIRRLRVATFIGVPDEERAAVQTLWVTVFMTPSQDFDGLADEISLTIDYYQVSLEIEALAAARPRRLIETLATDIASHLLQNHPLNHVTLSIEKCILPNTDCVAVHIKRSKESKIPGSMITTAHPTACEVSHSLVLQRSLSFLTRFSDSRC